MRWVIYNLLFAIVYVAMVPHFWLRMRKRGGYRARFNDRFGRYGKVVETALAGESGAPRPTWIHAVSVGEVYVAGQFMRALRQQQPGIRFVLSTTSSTGWREAEKQLGEGDTLIYNPLDFPWCVRRALAAIRPQRLILAESEIWPNLLRACARRDIPVYLVNARVSDRSAPGYRKLRLWFGPVLRGMRLILAQSELDRERLLAAGADGERVVVVGSAKFDVAQRDEQREAEMGEVLTSSGVSGDDTLILGGSTWPGEELFLLETFKRLRQGRDNLRLALAPRHFERAAEVAEVISAAGFRCIRRSMLGAGEGSASDLSRCVGRGDEVLLIDTTGELVGYYGRADIVFVGKSLYAHGGQNMVEPCLHGAAVVVGPHTENFRPAMADLLAAGGIIQVDDPEALAGELMRLVDDPAARRELGQRGMALVKERRGVVLRSAAMILSDQASRVSSDL